MKNTACALLLALALPAFADGAPLYDDLGARAGVHAIVTTLVPLVLQDRRIAASFDGIDMKHLALRLEEQFCAVSGGPCTYKGKDMKTIHDGLNITNAQFNALVEDLQEALDRNAVAPAVQNRLLAKLAPMQRDVVTK
ncbi:MAG: group I truncated hemoglobin [Telluria sp.]